MKRENSEMTWAKIGWMILICFLISLVAHTARGQNTLQAGFDYLICVDTMPSHISIGSKIPDKFPIYKPDKILSITQPIDYPSEPIKMLEYDRKTAIDVLTRLIVDLMEPGETITIKKVKE